MVMVLSRPTSNEVSLDRRNLYSRFLNVRSCILLQHDIPIDEHIPMTSAQNTTKMITICSDLKTPSRTPSTKVKSD